MNYELDFDNKALKEWKKLGSNIRKPFKKMFDEKILDNPEIVANKLHSTRKVKATGLYRLKLKTQGYRLVYHVDKSNNIVTVIGVGKRQDVYKKLGLESVQVADDIVTINN